MTAWLLMGLFFAVYLLLCYGCSAFFSIRHAQHLFALWDDAAMVLCAVILGVILYLFLRQCLKSPAKRAPLLAFSLIMLPLIAAPFLLMIPNLPMFFYNITMPLNACRALAPVGALSAAVSFMFWRGYKKR